MRIRPHDIEIPADAPFTHDLLNRKETAEILTTLMKSIEGPYTLAVDSSWGNGKTTFLRMLEKHLIREKFPVVSFNAWETDFTHSPLIALSSELFSTLKALDRDLGANLRTLEHKMRKLSRILLTKGVPLAISLSGSLVSIEANEPAIGPVSTAAGSIASEVLEGKLKDEPETASEDPYSYHEVKSEIASFKKSIKATSTSLSEKFEGKPLLVIIDELDRCRPSYAVELLEIAKHFFSVDQVVFVLAIDRSQLVHAIKSLYGNEFDSIGYLRRFIDLDFRLPDPDRREFVNALLARTGVDEFLTQNQSESWGSPDEIRDLLLAFFGLPVLSLRRVEQAIHRLGLVLASIPHDSSIAYLPVAVAIILRTIDPVTYHQFVQADMTDQDIIEQLFDMPGISGVMQTTQGALFEAMLIIAHVEFRAMNKELLGPNMSDYRNRRNNMTNGSRATTTEKAQAKKVMEVLGEKDHMWKIVESGGSVGFALAVQRVELFSRDLIEGT
ncbi:MAG: P-loop NTPase fold protein [Caldilineaceae bacterium]|nr:P-loop NTPase fold protein [Caldilineaceae bacterium]